MQSSIYTRKSDFLLLMGMTSVRKSRFGNNNQADALFYKVFLCTRCYCEFLGSKLSIYLVPFKCQCYIHSVKKAIHFSLGLSNALLFNSTEKKFLFVNVNHYQNKSLCALAIE